MMADGENLHKEPRTFGDRAARGIGENDTEKIRIEDPTAAYLKVNCHNVVGSIPVGCLVHNRQDVICDFALVHTPLRGGNERRAK